MGKFGFFQRPYPEGPSLLQHLRAARILAVYDEVVVAQNNTQTQGAIGSTTGVTQFYGQVDLRWMDGGGDHQSKVQSASTVWVSWLFGSGVFTMPNPGDIVLCYVRPGGYPVIIGYLPFKWEEMIQEDTSGKAPSPPIGNIRAMKSGEILIKSNPQAEVYLDRNGNVRFLTRDQSNTEQFKYLQSPPTDRVKSIDNDQVELVLGTLVGNTKDSNTKQFSPELINGKQVRVQLKVLKSGTEVGKFFIDEDGNIQTSGNSLTETIQNDINKTASNYTATIQHQLQEIADNIVQQAREDLNQTAKNLTTTVQEDLTQVAKNFTLTITEELKQAGKNFTLEVENNLIEKATKISISATSQLLMESGVVLLGDAAGLKLFNEGLESFLLNHTHLVPGVTTGPSVATAVPTLTPILPTMKTSKTKAS